MDEFREWVWLSADRGEVLTPAAMEDRINADRPALVGRSASTVVLRHGTGETVYSRTPGDLVVI